MRLPTSEAAALAWHTKALNDRALHLEFEIDHNSPECGWYEARLARNGIYVPARIWLEQEVCPDSGELLSDEVLRCEVGGREQDPLEAWLWMAERPISAERFNYLMARDAYAKRWAPQEPAANPFKPVDWLKVPTPVFTEEATP